MTVDVGDVVEYGELEDALGWIVEAPFRGGAEPNIETGPDILVAAAKELGVELMDVYEFAQLGFTRVLSGDFGLPAAELDYLLGPHRTHLAILLGIAAARGKVPGP